MAENPIAGAGSMPRQVDGFGLLDFEGFCFQDVPDFAPIQMRRTRLIAEAEMGNRKLGLEAAGRGTNVEGGMPVPHRDTRFDMGCLPANLNQHHDGRCHSNWCSRVHHDADWAVVSIAVAGVQVSDLRHCEQCKQNQANEGHQRYGFEARTARCAPSCSKSRQTDPFLI
jgi:hypothetical protein